MAGLGDLLARSQAAGGMMRESQPPEPSMTEEGAELPEAPAEEDALEGALAQVDAAVEGMDAGIAEEIRGHLNAIRDLASKEPQVEQSQIEQEAMGDPTAALPMEEKPGGMV